MSLDLSIVIPAFNEADRIETGFARLRPVLDTLDLDRVEVIVVDDGSTDGTGRTAAVTYGVLPHSLVIHQETNRGKGAAVRLGFTVASGRHVIVCDADMAIDPRHIPAITAALETTPLAFGTRASNGPVRYDSALRTRAGAAFNALVRRTVGVTSRDTQCGCKGFTLPAARLLGALGLVEGFAYDVELFYLASRVGLEITAVPVQWDDVEGSSVNVRRDSRAMWRDIRDIPKTNYTSPAVRLDHDVSLDEIDAVARSTRVQGVLVARGSHDSVVVVPRTGALAAMEIAQRIGGHVTSVDLEQLVGREFFAR